ncbi:MAG: DUF167 domain-containing protein [Terriglobales bacterium]
MVRIADSAAGATFAIRVHPRAKKNAITGELGDALKVSVTAPPVDGKANAACTQFFAKFLKVPRASVSIASGEATGNKVVRVAGLTSEQLRVRLRL